MKLAELYALGSGSKLGRPFIKVEYYPVPAERYIVVHAGGGNNKFPAKIYDLWDDVVRLIKPFLSKAGIEIVQLGLGDERGLNGIVSLLGKTNIHQSAYVIQNSILLAANDSCLTHIAGALNLPTVALYGPTGEPHKPYWHNPTSCFLESHRNNKPPSFQSQEPEKTINKIPPEQVARKILSILKIPNKIEEETLCVGGLYPNLAIDVVPDSIINPDFMRGVLMNLRADYLFCEEKVYQNLQQRPFSITTDRPLNLEFLKNLKPNVYSIAYEINQDHDIEFCKNIIRLGIPLKLFSYENETWVKSILLNYLDFPLIHRVCVKKINNIITDISNYQNILPAEAESFNADEFYVKSSKLLLSNNKFYASKSHWKINENCDFESPTGKAIFSDGEFFNDIDFCKIVKYNV